MPLGYKLTCKANKSDERGGVMEKVKVIQKDGKKYIDDEEVLCEYEPDIGIIKEFIFLISGVILYSYMKNKNFDVNLFWWIFFAGVIIITFIGIIKDIKSILIKKIYITQKHIITFNGNKISLNEIYFLYKDYGYFGWRIWKEINFYKKNKLIFFTNVDEKREDYKKFMDILVSISGNEDVAKQLQNYYAKRKLISIIGEKNGK